MLLAFLNLIAAASCGVAATLAGGWVMWAVAALFIGVALLEGLHARRAQ